VAGNPTKGGEQRMKTILATIQLDDGGGIGEIYAELEPSAYYED